MAAEYEVNIKINSAEIERELGKIDKAVAKIGKPKGGGSRRKPGIAGLLPSSEELRAAEKGIVQLTAKTKNIQSIQDKFSERRTRALTRSIALNEKELRLSQRMTAEARARLRLLSQSGAKGFDATRPKGRQLANDINARAKAQDKRSKLANKINEMEAKGLNVAKLRKQLGKATTEQARGRFAGAQKEFRLLQKTIELEQSKLRILKEQSKGFPSSPIKGTATMAGSPKQIAEFNKQAARNQRRADRADRQAEANRRRESRIRRQEQKAFQGRLRAGVGPESVFGPLRQLGRASMIAGADEAKLLAGRFRAPSSPLTARPVTRASADQAAKQVEKEVRRRTALEKRATDQAAAYRRRVNRAVSRAKLGLDEIEFKNTIDDIEKLAQRQIKEGEKEGRRFDRELKRREKARKDAAKARIKARNKRIGDTALGAGFPLLFGGGPGSVLGGALGGALGGGLAAQIGLSAVGQQIDQFIAGVSNIGKSLTSATGTLELFREKNLFSSDAVKKHAFELEKQGEMQELATFLAKDLASQIGKNAVESFQVLGGEVKEFLKTINHLFVAVGGFVAGPLAKLLEIINRVLGGVSTEIQFKSLRDSLTGEARDKFDAIVEQERGVRKLSGRELRTARQNNTPTTVAGKITTAVMGRVLANEAIPGLRQAIDITGQTTLDDTLGFKPTGPTKEEREETRLQKRLDQLKAERQAVIDVSRFKDKIAAANAVGDQQLVIRLQGEQKIAEIESKRLKDLAGVTDQREKDAINIGAATEKLAAHRDVERELGELQRKRQEKFETTIESLDHQLALARATTEEEREQLRIEEAIRKLRKDDKLSEPQLDAIKSRMEALAEENNLVNTFLKQTREQLEKLQDPMFQAVSLAQTLGDAFEESFKGIVTGSMTAQEALANLFQRTADHFLDMAAQMIAAQLKMQAVELFLSFFTSITPSGGGAPKAPTAGKKGTIPSLAPGLGGSGPINDPKGLFAKPTLIAKGFANGGRPPIGRPSVVGERGPELFVPDRSGTIVPNHAMGGSNIVVNVDASGSSVEGDSDQAAQLGKMLGAAVQAELVKQKRPGGLLAS